MNDRYVFLNFSLIFGLLTLIFSALFLRGIVDILSMIALFLALSLAFVLSICSLLIFMSLFNGVFFDKYSVFLLVLNWFFIGLISKMSSNDDKFIAKNQSFSIIFALYLIFNFILIFSFPDNGTYHPLSTTYYHIPLEMYFYFVPLFVSLILSIIFVITTLFKNETNNLETIQ